MKPSSSGPGRAIEGVFRDLRDRRLIPVVLLLVVLLFAVPMLLGKEETPAAGDLGGDCEALVRG